MPTAFGRFDLVTVGFSALVLAGWVVRPASPIIGVLLAVCGCLHIVRLARWAGYRTFSDRLVLVLHLAYAFMCALSLDVENIAPSSVGAISRDLSRVCSECLMTSRCRRELDAGSAGANYNEYCPNALTLDALLETQTRSGLAFQAADRRS